jgi:hypothetical protein
MAGFASSGRTLPYPTALTRFPAKRGFSRLAGVIDPENKLRSLMLPNAPPELKESESTKLIQEKF